MQSVAPITTDLVLLGAGHAHVEVLRRFAMRPEPGVRLTLIAREPHTPYSGMLPGLIRGEYGFDQAHIDLAPLASAAGARLILAEATGIELAARSVAVAGRPAVEFDLLSIDVGGVPAMPDGGGVPVKPIGQFLDRLAVLEASLPDAIADRRGGRRTGGNGTGAGVGAAVRRAVPAGAGHRGGRAVGRRTTACPSGGARGVGRGRGGNRLRRRSRRPVPGTDGAVGRQFPGGRRRAVGDGRDRARVAGALRAGLRCDRLRAGGADVAQHLATRRCSRPATVPRWRVHRGPRRGSGRCGPGPCWHGTCGGRCGGGR